MCELTFEVRVSGLSGQDNNQRRRSLSTVLNQLENDVAAVRFEPRALIVSFRTLETARFFVESRNGMHFRNDVLCVAFVQPELAAQAERNEARTPPSYAIREQPNDAPYHFVPVPSPHALTDAPVWHDRDDPGRVSGELQLEMHTLTPMLAANEQYAIAATLSLDATQRQAMAGWENFGHRAGIPPEKLVLDSAGNVTCYAPLNDQEKGRVRALLCGERREIAEAIIRTAQGVPDGLEATLAALFGKYDAELFAELCRRLPNDLPFAAAKLALDQDRRLSCVAQLTDNERRRLADYLVQHAYDITWDQSVANQFENLEQTNPVKKSFNNAREANGKVEDLHRPKPGKQVLEPLTLPAQASTQTIGPVLIAGAALDGMLRHSYSALLSAPMERVRERTFSFRPNVKLDQANNHLASCAGVVSAVNSDGSLRSVRCNRVVYVRDNAVASVFTALGVNEVDMRRRLQTARTSPPAPSLSSRLAALRVANVVSDVMLQGGHSERLIFRRGSRERLLIGCYLLEYRGGLDGKGMFANAFKSSMHTYRWVLVELSEEEDIIPANIVEGWRQTLRHIRDADNGHLGDHPNVRGQKEKERFRDAVDEILNKQVLPGDVFFYEKTCGSGHIVTLGHHFRYRWRYRDTIHFHADPPTASAKLREVLCPHELELPQPGCTQPRGLTPARRLFGYATATNEAQVGKVNPETGGDHGTTLNTGIGLGKDGQSTDYTQLAGRIGFNTAIEVIPEGTQDADRFLNATSDFLVPFRPLGSPKPSAVEHYLQQDPDRLAGRHDAGSLVTYGDTLDDPAGKLAGRKFYLHQPDAAKPDYAHCYELGRLDPDPGFWAGDGHPSRKADWRMREDKEMFFSDQAAIGRFVSWPERQFRVTLRFSNLDWWELGSVMLCLSPSVKLVRSFADMLGDAGEPVRQYLNRFGNQQSNQPAFANKLGHGRPLGLGSVEFKAAAKKKLQESSSENGCLSGPELVDLTEEDENHALRAFAKFLENWGDVRSWVQGVFLPWLAVHQYVGRTRHDYPRGARDERIFGHHSKLRNDHIGQRKREPTQPREVLRQGLKKTENL